MPKGKSWYSSELKTASGGTAICLTYTGQGQTQRTAAGNVTYQNDSTGIGIQTSSGIATDYTRLPDGTVRRSKRFCVASGARTKDALETDTAATASPGNLHEICSRASLRT